MVRQQADLGLRSATDGEFRRTSWHMDFIYQLGGVHRTDEKLEVHFHNAEGDLDFTAAGLRVDEPISFRAPSSRTPSIPGEAREQTGATAKLTIPSPSMVHYRGGAAAIDPSVYPDVEQFWADLSAAYAEQVRAIAELGCTLPAARRHEPGLPERPEQRARVAARVRTPSTSTSATSGRSTRRSPAGPRA